MKWLYIGLGVLGAITPTLAFYLMHLDRMVPGVIVDLGGVIYGFAVSIIFVPVGIALGLITAGVIHLGWLTMSWWRRPRLPQLPERSTRENHAV